MKIQISIYLDVDCDEFRTASEFVRHLLDVIPQQWGSVKDNDLEVTRARYELDKEELE